MSDFEDDWGNGDDDGGFGSVDGDDDGGFGNIDDDGFGVSDAGSSHESTLQEDPTTLFENTYYEAQDAFETGNKPLALSLYEKVLQIERDHPEVTKNISEPYGFYSLRETIWIYYEQGSVEKILPQFCRMLEYLPRRVGIAKFEEAFYFITSKLTKFDDLSVIQEKTLSVFRDLQQDLPRVRVLLRVAKQLFASQRWADLQARLEELKQACVSSATGQDQKTAQLMEVRSLELQMYEHLGDEHRVVRLWMSHFSQDKMATSVIGPDVKAPIDAVGGKILMHNQLYAQASNAFYRAMGFYDDIGNQEGAEKALRYRLVAEMLKPKEHKKNVDLFAEARSKIYMSRPNVVVFYNAYQAFQNQQVSLFTSIFDSEPIFHADPFLVQFRDALISTLRIQMLVQICPCYSNIRLASLADMLKTDIQEIERLICISIQEEKLSGSIDQISSIYTNNNSSSLASVDTSLFKWAQVLEEVNMKLFSIKI